MQKGKWVRTEEFRKKISDIGKVSQNNPEVKRKISEKLKGRPQTEETKRKKSISAKISMNRPEVKEKLRLYMINGGAQYTHSFITNPSKPQVELFNLVKQIDICPILNFAVKEVNKCIDIALPHRKIAIEYDGSYWHQDEEKDKQRQKEIESLGWKVIRYRDIVPSIDELRRNINGSWS
jgi:G:T-mismatch repair DNA endonuclease (very short patch repair protein)